MRHGLERARGLFDVFVLVDEFHGLGCHAVSVLPGYVVMTG
jgi:hypothetical protein